MALAVICVRMARGPTFVSMGRSEATELAKLAETPCCDVPVALANQINSFASAQGSGVLKDINAYNSQANIRRRWPGIPGGGPSMPVNARCFSDQDATMVQMAREAGVTSPDHTAKTFEVYRESSRDGVGAASLKHEPILGEEESHGFERCGLARRTPPVSSSTLTAAVSRAPRPGRASGESWVRTGMREVPRARLSVPGTSTARPLATRIMSSPSVPAVMVGRGTARGVPVTRRRLATVGTMYCRMSAALVPPLGVWRP